MRGLWLLAGCDAGDMGIIIAKPENQPCILAIWPEDAASYRQPIMDKSLSINRDLSIAAKLVR